MGADADIVILKPERYRYDLSTSLFAVNGSPSEGREFQVRVAATNLCCALAWDKGVLNAKGNGQFVRLRKAI